LIILTHCDESAEYNDSLLQLLKQFPEIPVLESIHEPLYFEDFAAGKRYQAEELANKRFLSLSSLADPLSAEESLKKLNLKPAKKIRFPDHYPYKSKDIEWLNVLAQKENVDFIATTEKDWVRLPRESKISVPILCLIMDFKITKSEKILDEMICKILEKSKT
jgi:tetraacyldisaccharide 4'-kinase